MKYIKLSFFNLRKGDILHVLSKKVKEKEEKGVSLSLPVAFLWHNDIVESFLLERFPAFLCRAETLANWSPMAVERTVHESVVYFVWRIDLSYHDFLAFLFVLAELVYVSIPVDAVGI